MIKIKARPKRKKRKLKKRFVILFILFIILIVVLMGWNSLKKIQQNTFYSTSDTDNHISAQLSTTENITDEQIYEKYNCKKVFKEYKDNQLTVHLSFDKDLFDNNYNTEQEYFEGLMKELAKNYIRDFILEDSNKNIAIKVIVKSSDNYNYTINGIENYFSFVEENNRKIKAYKEIEAIQADISHNDTSKFQFNKWSVKAADVKIQEKGDDYIGYGTYKILTNNTFINAIIFEKDFEGEIINGIKIGDSLDNIKKKMGMPTFEKGNMIGYKTTDVYAFFYPNEIAIYPNIKFDNESLESLITKYIHGEYTSRGSFAYEILQTNLDFKSYTDQQKTVHIESPTRGIKINIAKDGNFSADIYNNYTMTQITKQYIREQKMNTNFETDFIYESELDRIK